MLNRLLKKNNSAFIVSVDVENLIKEQITNNFNLFVLTKKVIQEKKENQNTIVRSRERKRIYRERGSGIYF